MKVAIIGAGNIGCAIAADLARKNDVRVYSSKPDQFRAGDGGRVY